MAPAAFYSWGRTLGGPRRKSGGGASRTQENFRKGNIFKNIEKWLPLLYFKNNPTSDALICRASGRKTQMVGKMLRKL